MYTDCSISALPLRQILRSFSRLSGRRAARLRPRCAWSSGFDSNDPSRLLDPHPTDILRLHLAAGVIDTLTQLAPAARSKYNQMIDGLSAMLATGDTVTIVGNIPIQRDHLQPMQLRVPLQAMQQAARNVGGFIATAKLTTLAGHSIQDIETWDDSDEARAQAVKEAVLAGKSIGDLGDDAQLLAGATIALLEQPGQYNQVTKGAERCTGPELPARPDLGGAAARRHVCTLR